ncbi:hypothetical protein XENOCAPTIV_011537 [Xenoophorus captivus]|uniref:Uncharacterized protein n=1 Tax=Xenoophorus captivus TaxID=1517983 RepID=A0ABV0R158_9TELE
MTSIIQGCGITAGIICNKGLGPIHTTQSLLVMLAACSTINNQLFGPDTPVITWNQSSAVKFPNIIFNLFAVALGERVVSVFTSQTKRSKFGSDPETQAHRRKP